MHAPLANLAAKGKSCKGTIPPPLVGASATLVDAGPGAGEQGSILLFGGRLVATRKMVSDLYMLDLATLTWSKLDPSDSKSSSAAADAAAASETTLVDARSKAPVWPQPRYFHSSDVWSGKLVIFGGMGYSEDVASKQGRSGGDGKGKEEERTDQLCVLDEVLFFDIATRTWQLNVGRGPYGAYGGTNGNGKADPLGGDGASSASCLSKTLRDDAAADAASGSPPLPRPVPRYAHLSSISSSYLVIVGGQNMANQYVEEINIFSLNRLRWVAAQRFPRQCGSYRSLAVSARWRIEDGGGGGSAALPAVQGSKPSAMAAAAAAAAAKTTAAMAAGKGAGKGKGRDMGSDQPMGRPRGESILSRRSESSATGTAPVTPLSATAPGGLGSPLRSRAASMADGEGHAGETGRPLSSVEYLPMSVASDTPCGWGDGDDESDDYDSDADAPEDGPEANEAFAPPLPVYVYTNYNFTDVRRELELIRVGDRAAAERRRRRAAQRRARGRGVGARARSASSATAESESAESEIDVDMRAAKSPRRRRGEDAEGASSAAADAESDVEASPSPAGGGRRGSKASGSVVEIAVQDQSKRMKGASLPPGLRFPTGAVLGDHLLISGTYLANTSQTFSIWALHLPTMAWQRLDVGSLLSTGSWNRAVLWPRMQRLIVFGHRGRDLVADYNHRQTNWDHVLMLELEAWGITQPPLRPASNRAIEMGLQKLSASVMGGFATALSLGAGIDALPAVGSGKVQGLGTLGNGSVSDGATTATAESSSMGSARARGGGGGGAAGASASAAPAPLLPRLPLSFGGRGDFEILCSDGLRLGCDRVVLERRWPYFADAMRGYRERARSALRAMAGSHGDAAGLGALSAALERLNPLEGEEAGVVRHEVTEPDSTRSATRSFRLSALLEGRVHDAQLAPRQLVLNEPSPVVLALLQFLYTRCLCTPLARQPAVVAALMILAKTCDMADLDEWARHAAHVCLATELAPPPSTPSSPSLADLSITGGGAGAAPGSERVAAASAATIAGGLPADERHRLAVVLYETAALCGHVCLQIRALRAVMAISRWVQRQSRHGSTGGGTVHANGPPGSAAQAAHAGKGSTAGGGLEDTSSQLTPSQFTISSLDGSTSGHFSLQQQQHQQQLTSSSSTYADRSAVHPRWGERLPSAASGHQPPSLPLSPTLARDYYGTSLGRSPGSSLGARAGGAGSGGGAGAYAANGVTVPAEYPGEAGGEHESNLQQPQQPNQNPHQHQPAQQPAAATTGGLVGAARRGMSKAERMLGIGPAEAAMAAGAYPTARRGGGGGSLEPPMGAPMSGGLGAPSGGGGFLAQRRPSAGSGVSGHSGQTTSTMGPGGGGGGGPPAATGGAASTISTATSASGGGGGGVSTSSSSSSHASGAGVGGGGAMPSSSPSPLVGAPPSAARKRFSIFGRSSDKSPVGGGGAASAGAASSSSSQHAAAAAAAAAAVVMPGGPTTSAPTTTTTTGGARRGSAGGGGGVGAGLSALPMLEEPRGAAAVGGGGGVAGEEGA